MPDHDHQHDVESELFERFRRQGDAAALAEVYDRTAAELLRVALHMSRSPAEAEDLVQSTFLAAIESAAAYDAGRALRPWLVGILANQARRRQRAEAQQARSLPAVAARSGAAATTADPLARSEADELTQAVDDAIAGLPETYRPVLRLHLKHGFLAAEIAHVLDRPPGTVRTQIVRGLDLLRKLLPSGLAVAGALLSLVGRGLAAVRERVLANVGNRVALTGALGAASLKSLLAALAAIALLALVVFGVWPWGPEPGSVGDAMAPTGSEVVAEKTATRPAEQATGDDESAARRTAAATATPGSTGSLLVSVHVAPDGGPLAGVGVSLVPEGADALLDQRQQRTDERGETRFADLPAGFMEVETDRGIGRRVEVRAGVESRLELLLEAGFDIEGRVVDEAGGGVAEAAIWLSKTGNQLYQGDVAGHAEASGAFVLRAVQGARVFVAARAPGRQPSCKVLVAKPESGRVARVTLKLENAGAALRGDVRDERDLPVAGASLRLGTSLGIHSVASCVDGGTGPPAVEARTDDNGAFAMEGLPAGRHPLLVRASGCAPWYEYVDVACAPASRLVIRLRRGLTLEGRVHDERGGAVAGARVEVHSYASSWSATSRTASDGSYRVAGLDPDRVLVEVKKDGYRELRRVLERERLVPSTTERSEGRPTVRFDLVLEPVLTLRGRLLDAEGAAAAGRVVMLVLPGSGERPRRVTDEAGRFTFTALEPVEHTLLLYAARGGAARPAGQACFEVGRVRPGPDEVTVRLPDRLPNASVIRGSVLDAEGRPVGSLRVAVTQLTPGGETLVLAASGSTEPGNGQFRITGLAPGHHTLVLGDGGATRPQLEVPAFELRPGEERDLGVLTLPRAGWLEVRADTTAIVLRGGRPRCEVHAADGRGVANQELAAGGLRLVLASGRYEVIVFGDGFVWEYRHVDVTVGRSSELALVLRPGVQRQLVFPVPEPSGWSEVRRFRVEIESRDGTVRIADDFEARDFWPFTWWPSLAPGSYVMRVTPDKGKALAGGFVVEDLLPRLAPIRVALQ